MFLLDSYVFTPQLIDLVTLAAHEGILHSVTQGRGVNSFIILTCERYVSEHTHALIHSQSSDHRGFSEVVPHDKVKKGRGLIENSVRDVNCALCRFLWKFCKYILCK